MRITRHSGRRTDDAFQDRIEAGFTPVRPVPQCAAWSRGKYLAHQQPLQHSSGCLTNGVDVRAYIGTV
jgi:hypothetical protein